mmetsp:Transcript_103322/g.236725  ORF Transcript_103322/g.236725 Transcript_103322/m.236725 type:complete len:219 (-) Transcript_103322:176-832(-)
MVPSGNGQMERGVSALTGCVHRALGRQQQLHHSNVVPLSCDMQRRKSRRRLGVHLRMALHEQHSTRRATLVGHHMESSPVVQESCPDEPLAIAGIQQHGPQLLLVAQLCCSVKAMLLFLILKSRVSPTSLGLLRVPSLRPNLVSGLRSPQRWVQPHCVADKGGIVDRSRAPLAIPIRCRRLSPGTSERRPHVVCTLRSSELVVAKSCPRARPTHCLRA